MGLPEQERSGITETIGDRGTSGSHMGSPHMALFCLSLSIFLKFTTSNFLCFQKLSDTEISFLKKLLARRRHYCSTRGPSTQAAEAEAEAMAAGWPTRQARGA